LVQVEAFRPGELAALAAGLADRARVAEAGCRQAALGGRSDHHVAAEDLDAVVERVGHENLVLDGDLAGHDDDVARQVELTRAAALAAEHAQELTIWAEDLHAIVQAVGDVDVAVRTDRQAPGREELTWLAAQLAPAASGPAVGLVDAHPVLAHVGHIDVAA